MAINNRNRKVIGIIDCRYDNQSVNDFFTLGIWGKLCFEYVCETVCAVNLFSEKYLLTESPKIARLAVKYPVKVVTEEPIVNDADIMLVSGKAIFLTEATIIDAISKFHGGILVSVNMQNMNSFSNNLGTFIRTDVPSVSNAFVLKEAIHTGLTISYYTLKPEEDLVINSINDFELALVLKKKKDSKKLLTKCILERIQEKESTFLQCDNNDTICLVGHSQLDNWMCSNIAGHKIRNCGIGGISSLEYEEYILKKNLLNCNSDRFIVMHGTNDIIYPYSDEFIIESISHTFDFIERNNPKAKIYFIAIANTNGRLDRSNRRINILNDKMALAFSKRVSFIDVKELSDEFGDLRREYTIDGLHFSPEGYEMLLKIVERNLEK